MGRGKPFKRSLKRLVEAGVVPKPVWMDIVEATRPPFQPVSVTKARSITYPEDNLRQTYLRRNPEARSFPVNLKARSVPDRHIADRFVSIQTELMKNQHLDEDEAYRSAERILKDEAVRMEDILRSKASLSLIDPSLSDETERLYLASVKDSQRDKALHGALMTESHGKD